MYIKYKDVIYNLQQYDYIEKYDVANKIFTIRLKKNDVENKIIFETDELRCQIFNIIWKKMKNGCDFYDIDLELYLSESEKKLHSTIQNILFHNK